MEDEFLINNIMFYNKNKITEHFNFNSIIDNFASFKSK